MTGNAVVGNKAASIPPLQRPWVLVTASFHHATLSHLVNNMLMLFGIVFALEEVVGGGTVIVLYIVTGVSGWALTLLHTMLRAPELWAMGVSQWQVSVGSSPSTYGLSMAAGCLVSRPIDRVLGIPLWVCLWSLWCVPPFLGDRYGVDLLQGREANWYRIGGALLLIVLPTGWLLATTAVALSATAVFGLYLVVRFVERLAFWLILRHKYVSSTDHACHLGGALAGAAAAGLLHHSASILTPIPMASLLYLVLCVILQYAPDVIGQTLLRKPDA